MVLRDLLCVMAGMGAQTVLVILFVWGRRQRQWPDA